MDDSLNKIVGFLNKAFDTPEDIYFGYGNENRDGISVNIISDTQNLKSYSLRTTKIFKFTAYCLYGNFKEAFSKSNQIANFLIQNRYIDGDNRMLKIVNVEGPKKVPWKQNKHLFIVEFTVIGL